MKTLSQRLEAMPDSISDESRIDEYRIAIESIENQLDSLAVAIESGRSSVPSSPEQWRRCLKDIARGGEWEHGTWR